jgi:apolipoprotein N-acyltransferase
MTTGTTLNSRSRAHRMRAQTAVLLTPMLGGLLLGSIFRWPNLNGLIWIALVPFASILRTKSHVANMYAGVFLGGLLLHLVGLDFLRTDAYGTLSTIWLILAYALTPFILWAIWCARVLVLRAGLPVSVALPMAWVAMEFSRRHILSTVFEIPIPYLQLASTQIDQTRLAQVADIVGTYGVCWMLVAVNGVVIDVAYLLWCGASKRRLGLTVACAISPLFLATAYGQWRLTTSPSSQGGPRVALLPGFLMAEPVPVILEKIKGWSDQFETAHTAGRGFDLIIWPEHNYHHPNYFALPAEPSPSQPMLPSEAGLDHVRQVAQQLRSGLILGAGRCPAGLAKPPLYNSLIYLDSQGQYVGSYDKISVVPMLEFQPRIARFIENLTGKQFAHPETIGNQEYTRGERYPVFPLPLGTGGDTSWFAGCICYDVFYSDVFRAYLAPRQDRRKPEFFVNIANSNFTPGAAPSALSDLRYRAIETRRPVVRSCWDGQTAVIDACGRIVAIDARPEEEKGAVVAEMPLDGRWTVYTAIGDAIPIAIIVIIDLYVFKLFFGWLSRLNRVRGSRLARFMPREPYHGDRPLDRIS